MVLYRSVMGEAEAEQVIDRSRFIGYIRPVESKEEADAFIAEIRALHKGATHNVPAFVIGRKGELKWASDDGEPSGTSGAPMMNMLAGAGLTNVAIVVTRYFGGIKLGTGGLVRAYTSTAKLALEAAGICEVKERARLTFRLDYTFFGKLQNLVETTPGFVITKTEFTDAVETDLECDSEDKEKALNMLTELTSGLLSTENISVEMILGRAPVTG